MPPRAGHSRQPALRLPVHHLHVLWAPLFDHGFPSLRPGADGNGPLRALPSLRGGIQRPSGPQVLLPDKLLRNLRCPAWLVLSRRRRLCAGFRNRSKKGRKGAGTRPYRRRQRGGGLPAHGRRDAGKSASDAAAKKTQALQAFRPAVSRPRPPPSRCGSPGAGSRSPLGPRFPHRAGSAEGKPRKPPGVGIHRPRAGPPGRHAAVRAAVTGDCFRLSKPLGRDQREYQPCPNRV